LTGIDTNVLARYILQDDEAQAARATAFMESCSAETPGFVSHLVLTELTWLLRHGYGYPKQAVLETLELLLTTDELRFEEPALAWAAYHDFRTGNADFSDCLLAQRHHHEGCDVTVTFDRKASKHALFRVLP
jgi:predicted nucleic-acid-binding protein